MAEIEFDFQTVRKEQQRLEDIAVKFNQIAKDTYGDTVQLIRQGWDSESGRKFAEKAAAEGEKLLHTAAIIRMAKESLYEAYIKAERNEERATDITEENMAHR